MSQFTFLLGAGTSIPAQLPSTDEITARLVSGEGVTRHTDSTYHLNSKIFYTSDGKTDAYVSAVTRFLSILYGWAIIYNSGLGRGKANYEDLYHMLDQIYDEELKEREGPVVGAFLNQIIPQVDQVDSVLRAFGTHRGSDLDNLNRTELFEETKAYVLCLVWRLLQKKPGLLDNLQCLVEACYDEKLTRVTNRHVEP